jgi:hypothetical protein
MACSAQMNNNFHVYMSLSDLEVLKSSTPHSQPHSSTSHCPKSSLTSITHTRFFPICNYRLISIFSIISSSSATKIEEMTTKVFNANKYSAKHYVKGPASKNFAIISKILTDISPRCGISSVMFQTLLAKLLS